MTADSALMTGIDFIGIEMTALHSHMLTDQPRELLRQILALENERSTASFRRAFFPCCMGIWMFRPAP